MVIREVAVDLREQLDQLATQRLEQTRREFAGHAVAGIDHDLHRTHRLDVADDAVKIDLLDIVFGVRALTAREVVVDDALIQRLDLVAIDRGAAQDHLEAVVVGRIVAARHDDARIDAPLALRQRSGTLAPK